MAFRSAFGFAPFSGLVNILGKKVLPYELSISAELGIVEYKSQTSPGPYIVANERIWHGSSIGIGLDQRILIYKNSGFKIGYFQYFENSFNNTGSNQRSTVTIGWYGRF